MQKSSKNLLIAGIVGISAYFLLFNKSNENPITMLSGGGLGLGSYSSMPIQNLPADNPSSGISDALSSLQDSLSNLGNNIMPTAQAMPTAPVTTSSGGTNPYNKIATIGGLKISYSTVEEKVKNGIATLGGLRIGYTGIIRK